MGGANAAKFCIGYMYSVQSLGGIVSIIRIKGLVCLAYHILVPSYNNLVQAIIIIIIICSTV